MFFHYLDFLVPVRTRFLKGGSVYNHTRVSLPSSHTHVVVSETQGFGYRHTSDDCTE